jgi:hypothetical protein
VTGNGRDDALEPFRALERHGVRWCLWRGTLRVDRAFAGASDFDLLVDEAHADALAAAFRAADCRRARTVRQDPGLEDWFGLAGPCGPLLHFHVHYRLVAGEPRLNRFRLPWERQVLGARVRLGGGPLFATDPVAECALLLLRCSLQLRARDRLPWSGSARRLLAKVNSDLGALLRGQGLGAVLALLQEWLGRAVPLRREGPRSLADLWRVRRVAAAALRPWTALRGLRAAATAWQRGLEAGLRRLSRRAGLPLWPARGLATGGAWVALAGPADAAQRASAADDVRRVFAGKFDVLRLGASGGQARRAQAARGRGMLVIGCQDVAAGRRSSSSAPDLVIPVGTGRPREQIVADVIREIWRRA